MNLVITFALFAATMSQSPPGRPMTVERQSAVMSEAPAACNLTEEEQAAFTRREDYSAQEITLLESACHLIRYARAEAALDAAREYEAAAEAEAALDEALRLTEEAGRAIEAAAEAAEAAENPKVRPPQ